MSLASIVFFLFFPNDFIFIYMFSSFVGLGLKSKSSHRATNTLSPCIHVFLIFCLLFVYACAVMYV